MPCEHLNFTGRFLWQLLQQCCLININDAPECLLFFSFLHSPSERLLICYGRLFRLDFNRARPTGAGGAGYSAVAVMTWNPHRIQEKKEKKNEHRLVSFGSSFSSAAAAILLALGLLDICPSAVAPVSAVQYTARCVAAAAARCCCSYYYSTLPIKNPRESHQLVRPNSLGSELRHKWRSVGYIDNIYTLYLSFLSFFSIQEKEEEEGGERDLVFPWHFPPYIIIIRNKRTSEKSQL